MSVIAQFVVRSFSVLALSVFGLYMYYGYMADPVPGASNTAPELEISSHTLEFGTVNVDEVSSAVLEFSNTGRESLTITSLFLDELDAQHYALSHQAPLTLEPSETIFLTISFEPQESGAFPGALFISHTGDGATDVVDLRGAGAPGSDEPQIAAANPNSFPFGKSKLKNYSGAKPTSLQFGPDGRLYVATQSGNIHVMTVEREGSNKYKVVDKETITSVKNIPNHNDSGDRQTNVKNRLVTGLLVTGTYLEPIIYVQSSDPRIGGGASGHTTGLDTNSGIISRLTKTGNGWSKLDLVRGLPRSEENHHGNGMALVGSKLYLAAGGNTNMGATSNNFALLPEYALSAAILEIDLDVIGNSTYDLPTLDDEDRPGSNDRNDPFGGNNGKNQAIIVENGPVQVYSPGWRNAYDVVVMQNGRMYSWDNGPNSGWGGAPSNCSNNRREPGSTQHDALHYIDGRGYYAGHPNPTRAHTKNKFNSSNPQAAVPYNNTVECNYYGPGTNGNGNHPNNKSMVSLPRSTTGLTEYTASNFNGDLQGSLLATSWDNKVHRVWFNSSGGFAGIQTLFSSVGGGPLDVTVHSDYGMYPGTVWVADYHGNDIVVYEPGDYQGNNTICIPGTGSGDADGDGFSDADELNNGTDVCSAADVPADADGDKISDFTDTDDDNDGIPDHADPFALDEFNGSTTPLEIDYQWENDDAGAGFIGNLGFSGLMINGVDNYQNQFDLNEMTIIGAAGVLTIDDVPDGDALELKNSQQYGFQLGVNAAIDSGIFRVHSRVLAPFSGVNAEPGQSMGIYIGNGDQDNYSKLVIESDGLRFLSEVNAQVINEDTFSESIVGADSVDLIIEVDPASAIATAIYRVTRGGISYAERTVGSVVFPASWLTSQTRLAVGIISTSDSAGSFSATWDFITVKKKSGETLNTQPEIFFSVPGTVVSNTPVLLDAVVVDDGLPNGTVDSQWSIVNAPESVFFDDSDSASTLATFQSAGTYELLLVATDGELSASLPVSIIVVEGSAGGEGEVVYRLNAGGPDISSTGGDWQSDSPYVNTGNSWSSVSNVNTGSVEGVPPGLFNTERYDPPWGSAMEWSLPVDPGTYEVRLYFAEIWAGAMSSGGRVFGVQVEDQLIEGIDVYSEVGANTAYSKIINVDSDQVLNIKTFHDVQNPAIKGIEVISTGSSQAQNSAPVVSAGEDRESTIGSSFTITGTAEDDGQPQAQLALQWEMIDGPQAVIFSAPTESTTQVQFNAPGTYKLRFSADDSELVAFDEVIVTITGVSLPGIATLMSPAGDISTPRPELKWSAVSGATWYLLWVSDSTTNPLIKKWYRAADAGCGSGTGVCSVEVLTDIANGPGSFWIRTWNSDGYGDWSEKLDFNVRNSTPEFTGGSSLSAGSHTLTWNGDNDVYWVYAGSSPGGRQYFDSKNIGSVKQVTISNLPVNESEPVYIRLWYRDNGGNWKYIDREYPVEVRGSTPVFIGDNSLSGESHTLKWSGDNDVYWVYAGSSQGGRQYFDSKNIGSANQVIIGNLPAIESEPVYVRLWYRNNDGNWKYIDREYLVEN